MRITQISINFSETCNLGDYSNTKPAIELTAQLDAADKPEEVLKQLIDMAKQHLHEEIDKELAAVGRELRYYEGPKFAAISSDRYKFYAVVPHEKRKIPSSYAHKKGAWYEDALTFAHSTLKEDEYLFFDCAAAGLEVLMEYIQERDAEIKRQMEERRQQEDEERKAALVEIEEEEEE